jgi:hypothetical protein
MILGPAVDPAPDRELPSDTAFRLWLESLDGLVVGTAERIAILRGSEMFRRRYTQDSTGKRKPYGRSNDS